MHTHILVTVSCFQIFLNDSSNILLRNCLYFCINIKLYNWVGRMVLNNVLNVAFYTPKSYWVLDGNLHFMYCLN
jgi:hypothetical protein